jgi:branched-chain amino acid transport system ATP-binding protein
MSERAPLLSARELHAGYGDMHVLRGATVDVAPAEIVALLGANGAGKSTLLRALVGLVPLDGGRILLDGEPTDGVPTWRLAANGLVMVPEGGRVFGPLSVRENLELGALPPAAYERREESREGVFALFPVLRTRQADPAEELSGGERQMLALARGIMLRPRVLCLDDPFLGLAREVADRVGDAIRATAARGVAVLLAGQHVARLLGLAHRACVLEEGRVTLEGAGAAFLADPRLREALLDVGRDIMRGPASV